MSSDGDFEEVASIAHQPQSTAAQPQAPGGFFVDDDSVGGGGFFPADQPMDVTYAGAGGFLPEESDGAQEDSYGEGGGLLVEESLGGGFLPEASSWNDSATGGGGFLPEDVDVDLDHQPPADSSHAYDFSQAGGFLPDAGYDAPAQLGSERIGLSAIPAALAALPWDLPIPADSRELLDLFAEIASEDELLGEPSVRRDKFDEACRDLRGSDDEAPEEEDEDDEPVVAAGRRAQPGRKARPRVSFEGDGGSDSDEEEFVPEGKKSGSARPRRATRTAGTAEVLELGSASSSGADSDEYKSDEDELANKKKKKSKPALPKKAKGGKTKVGRSTRDLTDKQIAGAGDTFDLFFEGSTQSGTGKTIGLDEIKRVAGLLNEKIGEMEMKEMLEYALAGAGTGAVAGVDLKAFAGVLAEVE